MSNNAGHCYYYSTYCGYYGTGSRPIGRYTCSDKSIEIESGKVLYQVVTDEGKGKLET